MNRIFALSVLFLIVTGFAGLATAHDRDDRIDIAYLNTHPEALGQVVEVSAKVIAINADAKSMELFDSQSRTTIQVNMMQLKRSERNALVRSNVRRVTVSGRAKMVAGRLVIDAQRIEALPVDVDAKSQTKPDAGSEEPR